MSARTPQLDTAFIEKQRRYLTRLRASLATAAKADEADEDEVKSESSSGPREYEDDAQKLAALELDGNLVVRDLERLARVDRALQKIEQGTYGLSDMSGEVIPRERLEAVPEAILTLREEETREQRHRV